MKELLRGVTALLSAFSGREILEFSIEDLGDGIVKDGTGDVLFDVKYQAVIFRPFKNEVLDGVVTALDKDLIHINVGPLDGAISLKVNLCQI